MIEMHFCPLYSGSSGNSSYIRSGKTRFLVDAGVSMKRIVEALVAINADPAKIDGILVTHEHSDHIAGVGAYARKFNIPVYITEKTLAACEHRLGKLPGGVRVIQPGQPLDAGDMEIYPFAIPHDAAQTVGFNIQNGKSKMSMLTDLGHITPETMNLLTGVQLIMLESNHDAHMLANGRYPLYLKRRIASEHGHLSNQDAGEALASLVKSGVEHAILAHLSAENNTEKLAMDTVCSLLGMYGIVPGKDVRLSMAHRDCVGAYTVLR